VRVREPTYRGGRAVRIRHYRLDVSSGLITEKALIATKKTRVKKDKG
jgi:hypothetical protein